MFGGLELKGPSKDDDSNAAAATTPAAVPEAAAAPASSGFSFLQSSITSGSGGIVAGGGDDPPASASIASDASANANATAATASVESSAATTTGMMPSAFGFLSASIGGSAEVVATPSSTGSVSAGQETVESAAPPAAAPSMFAGLTTASTAPASSEAPPPPAPPATSGFSFLSSPGTPASAPPADTNAASVAEAAPVASSSFSFMSSMMGGGSSSSHVASQDVSTENGETNLSAVNETKEVGIGGDIAPSVDSGGGGGLSGFSFLGSSSAAAPPPPPLPPADATPISTAPPSLVPESTLTPAATVPSSTSSSTSSWGGIPAQPTIVSAADSAKANNVAPSPAPVNSDLLSMSSPGLPTGAGVSWSAPPIGAAVPKKKVIKKRLGKTRVGIAAVGATTGGAPPSAPGSNIELPEPTTPSRPDAAKSYNPGSIPVPEPLYQTPQIPTTPQHTVHPPQMSPVSPPLREKAERAMQSADEFIREKQRSAIAMAAERAMHERSASSGGGSVGGGGGAMSTASSAQSLEMPSSSGSSGWKIGVAEAGLQQPQFNLSPRDETYQAAKAAAEEARKLADSAPAPKGKVSLFSNFFGRGRSHGSSPGNDISSYSSHGGVVTPGKEANERQETAGSLSPTKEEDNSQFSPTHNQVESNNANNTMEERAMQDAYREREMQIERERQRIAIDQQRKREEEAERSRLEFVAMEADRRRKEEEKQEQLRKLAEEEAARRRSPREKMQAILDRFADVTRTSTDRVTELRERRTKLVKDRSEAEKTERFAAQQISYAETQQTKAAEEEDFEAADRLATVIDRHTKERDEQMKIVKQIVGAIAQLDREMEVASQAVAACFHDVHVKLKELKDEHENRGKENGTDVSKYYS